MERGLFVISLDFELFWGIHDAFKIENYYDNVNNVKIVMPRLLALFDKYHICATFATVGTIYHKNFDEFSSYSYDVVNPQYEKKGLSPYEEENIQKEKQYPELHFLPEIIDQIRKAGQEIGTHTYSHYYCDEQGANIVSFDSDIRKAVTIARENGDNVQSVVFPRNQIGNNDFLKVIRKYGITIYRGNPYDNYSGTSLLNRLYRFCSAYIPITNEMVDIDENDGVINIPASHFLRPFSRYRIMNILQEHRIKRSMKRAAQNKKVFHLWWHPHNFGSNIEENMMFLESLLCYYRKLNDDYGMISVSMGNAARIFDLIRDKSI